MCDKGVDACLPKLKFLTDWFVTNKMLPKLDEVVLCNDESADKDFDNITFISDGMGLNVIDLSPIHDAGKKGPLSVFPL